MLITESSNIETNEVPNSTLQEVTDKQMNEIRKTVQSLDKKISWMRNSARK